MFVLFLHWDQDNKCFQADATGWMAFFSGKMLEIALNLSQYDEDFEDMALRFLQEYLKIATDINKTTQEPGKTPLRFFPSNSSFILMKIKIMKANYLYWFQVYGILMKAFTLIASQKARKESQCITFWRSRVWLDLYPYLVPLSWQTSS